MEAELQKKSNEAAILQEVKIYTKSSKCVLYEIDGHSISFLFFSRLLLMH